VLYLASDAAAFMTGSVVTLDGGITAGRPRLTPGPPAATQG